MNGFGKRSTAYFCYLIVNVWWYLSCIICTLVPPILVYEYFEDTHPDSFLGMSVPLTPSLVSLNQPDQYNYLAIDSVVGRIDFTYLIQNTPSTYILWASFICVVLGLFLYGLYQMRTLLKSSITQEVFTQQNIRRIKIIAVLVILIEPLRWLQQHFIFEAIEEIIPHQTTDVQLPMPGSDWGLIIACLLIYALAAVFEKGNKMYRELKLTV